MKTLETIQTTKSKDYWLVIADVLSQAITGELIGMANFASLSNLNDDIHEMMDAVEHADSERKHAASFIDLANKNNLNVNININGTYWKAVRESFLRWANKKDFVACILIQEIMLESFAVSMYRNVGEAIEGELGDVFTRISKEEESHLNHSIDFLRSEMQIDPIGFEQKVYEVHLDCMTILSEMAAKKDINGHCGVCNGNCMKDSLHHLGLDIVDLRGNSLNYYLKSLDKIGIPGEKSLAWISNLPV